MNPRSQERDQDPLGLRALPYVDPPGDGWEEIRNQLVRDQRGRRRRRLGGWAAAASVAVAVVLIVANPGRGPGPSPEGGPAGVSPGADTVAAVPSATREPAALDELVSLSQMLEKRLRRLRGQTGAVAGESALYIAELEDMIARVDGALTEQPESIDLWGQRVNLMLDLELIYQHHWEREYGRMAAL